MRIFLVACFALLPSLALAELTVDVRAVGSKQTTTTTTTTQLTMEDGTPIGEPVTTVSKPVIVDGGKAKAIVLKSDRDLEDATNVLVRIKCKTATVSPLSRSMYFIDAPGTHTVTVVVLAQNPLSWDEAEVTITNGPPPPPPPPPPPAPVANEYGLGQPAYSIAPRHPATALKYADIYRQAGDFLFGIPSSKFVLSTTDAHNNDPNRSVMAWISQQYDLVQCPDQATCMQWDLWRKSLREAIIASQKSRQFSRQDWYAAFNEIANALTEVANVQ